MKRIIMLTTIEGYYDNGNFVLNEVPSVTNKTAVIVTFLPNETNTPKERERILGMLEGKITIPENFNEI